MGRQPRGLAAFWSDPAVRWLAIARGAQAAAGPVLAWLALTRLTDEGRALYAMAVNLATFGWVIELGPATLLVQWVAHVGDAAGRARLRILASRWHGIVAAGWLAIAAGVLGSVVRLRVDLPSPAFWAPWLVVCAAVALHVLLVPAVAEREGGGATVAVQRVRAAQGVVFAMAAATGLSLGMPLLAGALAACVLPAGALYLSRCVAVPAPASGAGTLTLADYPRAQSRAALAWLALWVPPQLLVPIVLAARDAASAGPVAIGMAVALGPPALAAAWLHGRYASFGAMVAAGRVRAFDASTRTALWQAQAVHLAASVTAVGLVLVVARLRPDLAARLPATTLLGAMLLAHAALLGAQGMLAWPRAFGDEALAVPMAAGGAMVVAAAMAGAVQAGAAGAARGYAAGALAALALVWSRFRAVRAARLAHHPLTDPSSHTA